MRLLIIDDEPHIRQMMRLTLESSGYDVDEAATGEDGLARFGDGRGVDAVVLDQKMPGIDGLETLRRIRERTPDACGRLTVGDISRDDLDVAAPRRRIDEGARALQASEWPRPATTPRALTCAVTTALTVQIRRLPSSAGLALPTYMTPGAAGMDLHAAVDADVMIAPGDIVLVPTGLEVAIPDGFEGQVRPRSGLAVTHGISLPNTPATIDADYRGEIRVPLINLGRAVFTVSRGMRIAQLVIAPVVRITWAEVADLPATGRGEKGFGHSGV